MVVISSAVSTTIVSAASITAREMIAQAGRQVDHDVVMGRLRRWSTILRR